MDLALQVAHGHKRRRAHRCDARGLLWQAQPNDEQRTIRTCSKETIGAYLRSEPELRWYRKTVRPEATHIKEPLFVTAMDFAVPRALNNNRVLPVFELQSMTRDFDDSPGFATEYTNKSPPLDAQPITGAPVGIFYEA